MGVRFSHPLFFCAQNHIREKQTRVPAESEAEVFSAADFAGIFLSLSSGGAEYRLLFGKADGTMIVTGKAGGKL